MLIISVVVILALIGINLAFRMTAPRKREDMGSRQSEAGALEVGADGPD